SRRKARISLAIAVCSPMRRERARCKACRSSCSAVLVATKRMVGRWTASAMVSASLAQNDGAALVEADEVECVLADAEDGDGVFRVGRHGRAPCLGWPPARRWGTAGSTAGPSH